MYFITTQSGLSMSIASSVASSFERTYGLNKRPCERGIEIRFYMFSECIFPNIYNRFGFRANCLYVNDVFNDSHQYIKFRRFFVPRNSLTGPRQYTVIVHNVQY
jgi:hypothetical protein